MSVVNVVSLFDILFVLMCSRCNLVVVVEQQAVGDVGQPGN